jgi:hypothetical protein
VNPALLGYRDTRLLLSGYSSEVLVYGPLPLWKTLLAASSRGRAEKTRMIPNKDGSQGGRGITCNRRGGKKNLDRRAPHSFRYPYKVSVNGDKQKL